MSCDERDSDRASGQEHGVVCRARARREKFGLTRKFESYLGHPRFVNRAGNDSVDFAGIGEGNRFFQGGECSPGGIGRWSTRNRRADLADYFIVDIVR